MKRFLGVLLLLFVGCGVLAGCGETRKNQMIEDAKFHLFYISADETELIQDVYTPADESTPAMISELLQFLSADRGTEKKLPLLPEGVEINTHVIDGGILTLEFNKQYMQMTAPREVLTRAGVVMLFAQLPDIDYVKFSVNGKDLKDSKGIPISIMNRDTFVEYTGESLNSYDYVTITLYFTNQEGNQLIPEERTVYYNSNVPLERVVIEQLMRGPETDGLYPTLPSGFSILGVTTDEGSCYLNLDRAFVSNVLPLQNKSVSIYSIVNSIVDDCQKSRVQISINGETNVTFPDNIGLNQFFEKNDELIQK